MDTVPAYRDPFLPVETRVADLLSRMTLAEKYAQLIGPWGRGEAKVFLPSEAMR